MSKEDKDKDLEVKPKAQGKMYRAVHGRMVDVETETSQLKPKARSKRAFCIPQKFLNPLQS